MDTDKREPEKLLQIRRKYADHSLDRMILILRHAGLTWLIPSMIALGSLTIYQDATRSLKENYALRMLELLDEEYPGLEGRKPERYDCYDILGNDVCFEKDESRTGDRSRIGTDGRQVIRRIRLKFEQSMDFHINGGDGLTEEMAPKIIAEALSKALPILNDPEIDIIGVASPEGITPESITGKDPDSQARNERLAKDRAEYVKRCLMDEAPEIGTFIEGISGFARSLSETDSRILEGIAGRCGIRNAGPGSVQHLLREWNSGKISEKLSETDRAYLQSLFDRFVEITITHEPRPALMRFRSFGELLAFSLFATGLLMLSLRTCTKRGIKSINKTYLSYDQRKNDPGLPKGAYREHVLVGKMFGFDNISEGFLCSMRGGTEIRVAGYLFRKKTDGGPWEFLSEGHDLSDSQLIGILHILPRSETIQVKTSESTQSYTYECVDSMNRVSGQK